MSITLPPICLCGCGKRVSNVSKGDPARGIIAGSPRKYASHQCYLNHRKANRLTHCRTCGFKKSKRGKTYRCIRCGRARIRAKKYKITLEQALNIPDRCQVCQRGSYELGEELQVDHCHKTGRFRGWLCRGCNTALGHLDDDPMRIELLLRYAVEQSVKTSIYSDDAREIPEQEVFNWNAK